MIIQESDAANRWCPFVRLPWTSDTTSAAATNRRSNATPEKLAPCLGSRCMAWRRVADVDPDRGHGDDGFCGLAGRPIP